MKSIFYGYIYFWIVENWNEVRFLSFITFLHLRSLFVSYPGSGRSWLRSMFEVNRFSLCTILLRSNQFWVLCCALISHKNTDDCVYGSKKKHSKSLFYNWRGKSSDFVRIAVSLRGSPTAQVSQHVFFQSKKAGL